MQWTLLGYESPKRRVFVSSLTPRNLSKLQHIKFPRKVCQGLSPEQVLFTIFNPVYHFGQVSLQSKPCCHHVLGGRSEIWAGSEASQATQSSMVIGLGGVGRGRVGLQRTRSNSLKCGGRAGTPRNPLRTLKRRSNQKLVRT